MRSASCLFATAAGVFLWAGSVIASQPAASAVPVYVNPRPDQGNVAPTTPVVAFSYDARQVYAQIDAQFAKVPESERAGQGPIATAWRDYTLLQAAQLEAFPASFRRSHQDEPELLKAVMPHIEEVYKRHGVQAPTGAEVDVLTTENPRKVWCQKVSAELNEVLKSYGEIGSGPGSTPISEAMRQRMQAFREASATASGNNPIRFVESATNDHGLAYLDLPPGVWWVACQAGELSWYKPIRVVDGSTQVIRLEAQEQVRQHLNLSGWKGQ